MTSHEITIENENGTIAIYTPYNPDYISAIKTTGAKWDAEKKAWTLPSEMLAKAREICRNTYGYDDTTDPDLVSVRDVYKQDVDRYAAPVVSAAPAVIRRRRASKPALTPLFDFCGL